MVIFCGDAADARAGSLSRIAVWRSVFIDTSLATTASHDITLAVFLGKQCYYYCVSNDLPLRNRTQIPCPLVKTTPPRPHPRRPSRSTSSTIPISKHTPFPPNRFLSLAPSTPSSANYPPARLVVDLYELECLWLRFSPKIDVVPSGWCS